MKDQTMESMETVTLPVGAWTAICKFMAALPGSAWGNIPAQGIAGMLNTMGSAPVTPVVEEQEVE